MFVADLETDTESVASDHDEGVDGGDVDGDGLDGLDGGDGWLDGAAPAPVPLPSMGHAAGGAMPAPVEPPVVNLRKAASSSTV